MCVLQAAVEAHVILTNYCQSKPSQVIETGELHAEAVFTKVLTTHHIHYRCSWYGGCHQWSHLTNWQTIVSKAIYPASFLIIGKLKEDKFSRCHLWHIYNTTIHVVWHHIFGCLRCPFPWGKLIVWKYRSYLKQFSHFLCRSRLWFTMGGATT